MTLLRKIGVLCLAYAIIMCVPLALAQSVNVHHSNPLEDVLYQQNAAQAAALVAHDDLGETVTAHTLLRELLFGDGADPSVIFEAQPHVLGELMAFGGGDFVVQTRYDEAVSLHVTGFELAESRTATTETGAATMTAEAQTTTMTAHSASWTAGTRMMGTCCASVSLNASRCLARRVRSPTPTSSGSVQTARGRFGSGMTTPVSTRAGEETASCIRSASTACFDCGAEGS